MPSLLFDFIYILIATYTFFNNSKIPKLTLLTGLFFLATFVLGFANYFLSEIRIIEGLYLARPWIYISIFLLIYKNLRFKTSLLQYFVYFYVIKVVLAYLILGQNSRAGLLMENNFDILFLLIFFATEYFILTKNYKKMPLAMWALTVFTVIVSLSKGALLGLMVLLFGQLKKASPLKILLILILIPVALSVAYVLRPATSLEEIDRYIWLQVAIADMLKNPHTIWFGHQPFSYIETDLCKNLFFREQQLGSHEHGCISTVFVSHILRFLWDFGLVGLLFFYSTLFYIIIKTSKSAGFSLVIIVLFAINGLSVSSISAGYGIICLLYVVARLNFEGLKFENDNREKS